jgi:hypothetical protein
MISDELFFTRCNVGDRKNLEERGVRLKLSERKLHRKHKLITGFSTLEKGSKKTGDNRYSSSYSVIGVDSVNA